jgi:TonB family protein
MKSLFTIALIAKLTFTHGQELTLYYNDLGELTIPALASHFRIANFDSLTMELNGTSYEYDYDSSLIGIYYYKEGSLIDMYIINENEDTTKYNLVQLNDSLQTIIENKNSYTQATYVRKNDYPLIIEKLSTFPMEVPQDSILFEGKKIPAFEIFTIVEDPAKFPGGNNMMIKFLSFYLKYPKEAQDAGISGKVYVDFIINKDGRISDVNVTKGIGYGCDEAAIYAMQQLPDWKPGYQRGKPISMKMTIPITFQ